MGYCNGVETRCYRQKVPGLVDIGTDFGVFVGF